MDAFTALVRKDVLLHLANRRALLMSLLAPVLIAAFFGSLFGGSDTKPSNVPVAVTDLDDSELSRRVVAELRGDSALAVTLLGQAEAQAQVRAGKQRAAVTLPAGFGAQAPAALFGTGAKPEIGLVYDPSQGTVLPLVRGLLAQHVMQPVNQAAFSSQSPALRDMRQQALASPPGARRDDLVAMFDSIARVQDAGGAPSGGPAAAAPAGAAGGLGMPFTTNEVAAVAPQVQQAGYNGYAHSFAGMGVQFILLMGVEMGIGLLMMRRLGLWKRLRAAPLSRAQLLGSRTASCALIALASFAVIYAVAFAAFGVRVNGSVLGFVAVLAAFALLTASFGLMIAALGRTPEATRGLAILATLLLVMLGGAWVPSFVFPPWLQTVSAWVPTHWAIEGLDGMTWRGQPLSAAVMPVLVMLGFTAVFTAVALARFDWEE